MRFSNDNLPELGRKVRYDGSGNRPDEIGFVFAIVHRYEIGQTVWVDTAVASADDMAQTDSELLKVDPSFLLSIEE